MADTDAFMPLFVGDYLADTSHLSTEGHGAYLLLLMHSWRTGPLQDDPASLARIARLSLSQWLELAPTVVAFFDRSEGMLTHGRVEKERAKASQYRKQRKDAGLRGAAKRWGSLSHSPANGETMAQLSSSHSGANARAIAEPMLEQWHPHPQPQEEREGVPSTIVREPASSRAQRPPRARGVQGLEEQSRKPKTAAQLAAEHPELAADWPAGLAPALELKLEALWDQWSWHYDDKGPRIALARLRSWLQADAQLARARVARARGADEIDAGAILGALQVPRGTGPLRGLDEDDADWAHVKAGLAQKVTP